MTSVSTFDFWTKSANALGIAAASFASVVITQRAKIQRKARRRSRNAQERNSESQNLRISEFNSLN